MNKSTHRVEVVPLKLEKHPGADKLSVVRVFGFTCVTQTSQWGEATLAAFVPDDTLVPVDHPAFAFLASKAKYEDGTMARIKPIKLRGVQSMGLLVAAPPGAKEGDDAAEFYRVKRYEPPIRGGCGGNGPGGGLFTSGEVATAPEGTPTFKYDLEAGRRYAHKVFTHGEPVVVTEKLHGASSRYVFDGHRMHCGSRNEWKKEYPSYEHVTTQMVAEGLLRKNRAALEKSPDAVPLSEAEATERAATIIAKLNAEPKPRNMWWQALDATPALRAFCEANPGVVVYGEVYGAVQDLPYGHKKGEVSFAAFDMWEPAVGRFMDAEDFLQLACQYSLPRVPLLNETAVCDIANGFIRTIAIEPIPFDFDAICAMAEGPSLVKGAANVREGVVVKPLKERWDEHVGRVAMKWVGNGYLERSPDPEPAEVACGD